MILTMKTDYTCNYCNNKSATTLYDGIRDWEYGIEGEYQYRQCDKCSGVQIFPFPELPDLIKAYDIDYHGYIDSGSKGFLYNLLYRINDKILQSKLKKYVPVKANVLDVGCGTGALLLAIRKMGAENLQGIDFNDRALDMLRKKGIEGFKGTFNEFEKEEGYYDLIIMNNYLEHTTSPLVELAKAKLLLKSGGHIIGEVPGFDSYERKFFKKYWGGNHIPRHTYQFNQDFLKGIFAQQGFTDIQIEHQLNTGHIALSVQNYMQRNVADLRHNKHLLHGRSRLYFLLLLFFIPFNVIPLLMKKSGVIKFSARV